MSEDIKVEMNEGNPPTYDGSNSDPPPSYDSIFGRMQKAKEESSGNVEYAQKVVAMACCGTICTLISLALLFTIPIVNVVIGSVYLNQCDIERYIPIYLIVAGVFGIVKGALQLGLWLGQKKYDDEDEDKNKPNPVDQILNCFLFAWFIAGSVWVYSNHDDVQFESKGEKDYCHEVCYKYAFWFITISYIFMGLLLLCCCGGMIVACIVACKGNKE